MNQEIEFKKKIETIVEEYLKSRAFTQEKLTDMPTDNLQVVNRKYVNLNGTLANRPSSSVATLGQRYFATDLSSGTSITWSGSNWTNGVGSVIAG